MACWRQYFSILHMKLNQKRSQFILFSRYCSHLHITWYDLLHTCQFLITIKIMYAKYYFPIFHPEVHKIINKKVKLRISCVFRFSDRSKLSNKSG